MCERVQQEMYYQSRLRCGEHADPCHELVSLRALPVTNSNFSDYRREPTSDSSLWVNELNTRLAVGNGKSHADVS